MRKMLLKMLKFPREKVASGAREKMGDRAREVKGRFRAAMAKERFTVPRTFHFSTFHMVSGVVGISGEMWLIIGDKNRES